MELFEAIDAAEHAARGMRITGFCPTVTEVDGSAGSLLLLDLMRRHAAKDAFLAAAPTVAAFLESRGIDSSPLFVDLDLRDSIPSGAVRESEFPVRIERGSPFDAAMAAIIQLLHRARAILDSDGPNGRPLSHDEWWATRNQDDSGFPFNINDPAHVDWSSPVNWQAGDSGQQPHAAPLHQDAMPEGLSQAEQDISLLDRVRDSVASDQPKWPIPPPEGTALTRKMGPKEFAKQLGMSPDALMEALKNGTILAHKYSDRSYQFPAALVPTKK